MIFMFKGPYVLIWGSLATILSKEVYVYWVDTLEHIVFFGLVIAAAKKVGPTVAAYLDKESDAADQKIKSAFETNLKRK